MKLVFDRTLLLSSVWWHADFKGTGRLAATAIGGSDIHRVALCPTHCGPFHAERQANGAAHLSRTHSMTPSWHPSNPRARCCSPVTIRDAGGGNTLSTVCVRVYSWRDNDLIEDLITGEIGVRIDVGGQDEVLGIINHRAPTTISDSPCPHQSTRCRRPRWPSRR